MMNMMIGVMSAAIDVFVKDVCAYLLLALILYAVVRKMWRKKERKCAMCGRNIAGRPVKVIIGGEENSFCCEHCADAYVRMRSESSHT